MTHRLLTTGEVADLLGVCHYTVDRWCDHRGLPHTRPTGGYRSRRYVSATDLLRWLRHNAVHLTRKRHLSPQSRWRISRLLRHGLDQPVRIAGWPNIGRRAQEAA